MIGSLWAELIELLWLGSLQSLPVLAIAWVLDRALAHLGQVVARRVVWMIVLLELFVPPTLGSTWHLATVDVTVDLPSASTAAASFALATAIVWGVGLVATLLLGAWFDRRTRRALMARTAPLPVRWQPLARQCAERIGLGRLPSVVVSPRSISPCALGILRPVVVIDRDTVARAAVDDTGRERLEHALLHEFGHLRRRDSVRALLVRVVIAVWWFHPSAWLVARRFALFRELSCDALVASVVNDRGAYARTLVHRAEQHVAAVPAPAFVRLPAEVVQRVVALRRRGRTPMQFVATAVAMLALLSSHVPVQAAAAVAQLPVLSDRELQDLPGCLQRRYYILSRLAAATSSSDRNLTSEPR